MRRLILFALLPLVAGCAWFRDPPRSEITTGATIVYNGGPGGEVFSICDRGDKIFLTKSQPALAVIKDGCNPQATHDMAAQVAAWRAIAERRTEVVPPPTQPEPKTQAQPPVTIPQPLLVQLVPVAPESRTSAALESREPVIVQIQPQSGGPPQIYMIEPTCPACPIAPPVLQPQARVGPPPPAAKVKVVQAVDPNTASLEDLERLPGVTSKTAQAIVKGRPYRTPRDLVDKRVLTEAEATKLAPYFVIR